MALLSEALTKQHAQSLPQHRCSRETVLQQTPCTALVSTHISMRQDVCQDIPASSMHKS